MKIIPKHQQGGGFIPLLNKPSLEPIHSMAYLFSLAMFTKQLQETQAKASSKSSSSGLIDDDLIKELYLHGLPNDVALLLNKTNIFSSNANPFAPDQTAAKYQQLVSLIPQVRVNKELFDKAMEKAEARGSLSEVATTADGRVFTMDAEGKLQKKSVSEISKNETLLSVGDLAQLRTYSPSMAFDNGEIVSAINSSTSMKEIFANIKDITADIGTTERGSLAFVSKKEGKLQEGLEQILGLAEDGTYKIETTTKSQTEEAKAVLKFIMETLPENQRTLLLVYAKKNGMDVKTGPMQIILDYLQGRIDNTFILKVTGGPGETSTGAAMPYGKTDVGLLEQIITGDGLASGNFEISYDFGKDSLGSGSSAFVVQAQIIPYIPKAEGSGNIGQASAAEAITGSQLGRVLDTNSIFIGKQRIDPADLGRLFYSGDLVYAMDLPYTTGPHGETVVNWELMEDLKEAEKEIAKRGGKKALGAVGVNQIYRKRGLDNYYNNDGSINRKGYKRFLAINLIGDESIFKNPEDQGNALTRISNNTRFGDEKKLKSTISQALSTDNKHKYKVDGDLYAGVAYIPIYDSMSLARTASGNYMKAQEPGYLETVAGERVQDNHVSGNVSSNNL